MPILTPHDGRRHFDLRGIRTYNHPHASPEYVLIIHVISSRCFLIVIFSNDNNTTHSTRPIVRWMNKSILSPIVQGKTMHTEQRETIARQWKTMASKRKSNKQRSETRWSKVLGSIRGGKSFWMSREVCWLYSLSCRGWKKTCMTKTLDWGYSAVYALH